MQESSNSQKFTIDQFNGDFSPALCGILKQLLCYNPDERPDASMILKNSYFDDVRNMDELRELNDFEIDEYEIYPDLLEAW